MAKNRSEIFVKDKETAAEFMDKFVKEQNIKTDKETQLLQDALNSVKWDASNPKTVKFREALKKAGYNFKGK